MFLPLRVKYQGFSLLSFLSDADPRHAWFGCVTGIVISIIYMECLPFMPSYRAV